MHLSDDHVALFVRHALPEGELAELEQHLQGCDSCLKLVSQATRAALRDGEAKSRYHLLGLIGSGSMGAVFAAYDHTLQRKVALKRIRGQPTAERRNRLLSEARSAARLRHPNVVAVHDVGEDTEGLYLSMELVEGVTLRQWLAQEPRSQRAIVGMFLDAGAGLAAAHRAGIVHRDFKPENVLVNETAALVTDFGLSRTRGLLDAEASADDSVEVLVGTPAYLAPEVWAGAVADERSDQYSFCVSLYEALLGQRPFSGSNVEEIRQSIRGGLRAPLALPRPLQRVLQRGLSLHPEHRFDSVQELLNTLRETIRPPRWKQAALVATITAGLVVVGGWLSSGTLKAQACAEPPPAWSLLWSPQVQEEVRRAFIRTQAAYAPEAFSAVSHAFTQFSEQWRTARKQACAATYVHAQQSTDLLDRRLACLDRRLLDAKVATRTFATADAEIVSRALDTTASLLHLDDCANAGALLGRPARPVSPEGQALETDLAQSVALRSSGKLTAALQGAQSGARRSQGAWLGFPLCGGRHFTRRTSAGIG